MASPATDAGRHAHQQRPHASGPAPEAAVRGAQRWIEAVTGRSFGEKDFRGGLENGILLCELLSSVKPGLVKKINRLATPIAGLDNVTLFLRGCEELGLKGSQLFDPGDLQDTPTPANRGSDCNRRLKNVLITIYWLGKAANSCASYSGPTLDLKEFEGLLSQMRKEAEDSDSPKRNIRDSGYIDCWDSERSDSLSPPRHGREDSFDSLDSFGSRSRQTPSPDVLAARGSSDGRGSDSESDFPHRKLPDVRKDDMLARRTSVSELRTALPFNQYLPNKSNQSGYDPAALRRKRVERDDGSRKSWSTATSPIGGERPFSVSDTIACEEPPVITAKEPPLLTSHPPPEPHQQGQEDAEEDEEDDEDDEAVSSSDSSVIVRLCLDYSHFSTGAPHSGPNLTEGSQPSSPARSSSVEFYRTSLTTSTTPTSIVVTSPLSPSPTASPDTPRKFPSLAVDGAGLYRRGGGVSPTADSGPDDAWTRKSPTSPKHGPSSPTPFLPVPMAAANPLCRSGSVEADVNKPRRRCSWMDDEPAPTSVSMIDMRYEEEVFLHPHSQVRHELMHNQYNQMKEEEDHWQDDLARWKSRRRSVSQDLIKKEEERKTMERLMSGEGGISQRRKSIKTYREILEEKEHRERELYNAYHRARTPEEAHEVLQRYAQRFSISESVMETLKLPKLLERSVSADPMAARLHDSATSPSPSSSSNPMQYLRQQSLPAPKFTSTVEAMVSGFPRERRQSPSPERPPKAAPLLTPKPDSQDHNTHPGGKPVKGDGLVRVNGESVHNFSGRGIEREEERMKERRKESSSPSPEFLPCPDSPESTAPASLHSTHKPDNGPSSRTDPAPPASTLSPEVEQHTHSRSLAKEPSETQELQEGSRTTERLRAEPPLAPAHSTTAATEFTPKADHVPERVHVTTVSPEPHNHTDAISPTAASACHTPSPVTMDTTTGQPIAGRVSGHLNGLDSAEVTDPTTKCAGLCSAARQPPASSKPELRREFFASPETARKEQSEVPPTVLNLVKQAEHWSWDPDEERRRQQRWQQEQERRLQEKYRREQEKLQQEWERAQREVEEEERKYHEQEQRILEETLAPLTPHSPALHPRHKPSAGDPALPAAPQDDGTRTLGSWELKQEKKLRGEWNQRGNDGSDVGPEEGRLPPAESTDLLSSGWSEPSSHSQHYSQKVAGEMGQARDAEDSTWSGKQKKRDPSQRRRSESGEDTPQSPSCPPDTPPPSPSRSVSGKKLCSSCGHPLGKGAAMIIETLSLYFHIQCFKCGICKGQLGDTTTGTDVRIRNGLLNCHQCYIRSRSAGQPTTL
ncbi:LIM and calponin homology domains-containing protein 1 isoform X3 [Denticeps clupeoides]|uniref:LIM and calponin homology domains-containing protein 1 isoform X3 n=1 Tax=Denticeps clupeoides TaxID=299321 RepID=UPI0010A2C5D4|nr:LIM and calponin homology domains-containing protein 1 isoform X3 [Denticeps clupeoides]